MLYKPKQQAKVANGSADNSGNGKSNASPPPAVSTQKQQPAKSQHHHHQSRWQQFTHLLSAIGQFSLFGSHHNLSNVSSNPESRGNPSKEEAQSRQEQSGQAEPPQIQPAKKHMKRGRQLWRQHQRQAVTASCHNLASASTMLTGDDDARDGLTFSDDEEGPPGAANRVAKWATGLGHLLADPIGVGVFAEFLRGEFSEENITFWLAVEDFKKLEEPDEILAAARDISRAHIGCDAPASVNIDYATVRCLQSRLGCSEPPPDCCLFNSAQEHIFNLMRMDSYARFLKSPLYKDSLLCELESRPLPTPLAGPSPHSSRHSMDPLPDGQQQQRQQQRQQVQQEQVVGKSRRQSRDVFLRQQQMLDPTAFRRSRQPSLIVAALDLDCGFSVC